jgi:hypothetical protein
VVVVVVVDHNYQFTDGADPEDGRYSGGEVGVLLGREFGKSVFLLQSPKEINLRTLGIDSASFRQNQAETAAPMSIVSVSRNWMMKNAASNLSLREATPSMTLGSATCNQRASSASRLPKK